MEFWGVEVRAGQPLKVQVEEDKLIHLSQASLGESKGKGNESVPLFLKFGDQKLVLGTLSQEKFPQLSFDLVFEKEFELSHNSKSGSVYFVGYKAVTREEEDDEHDHDHECESESESDDDEESLDLPPLNMPENGKAAPKVVAKSVAAKSSEKQVKVVEPKKDEEDDETSDEDDDDSDEDIDDLEDMSDDDLLGESDDEPEETPKKAESGKKRPSESATKTPVPTKKAKAATPQKTDGKKGGHTATPHPSKKAGKTPANSGEQSKPQTPKSAGGSFPCKSCSKVLNSEVGLQSHTKAKHGDK
jgi:hypothetical protein